MAEEKELSHIDDSGRAQMVDVGEKAISLRWATARSRVSMSAGALARVAEAEAKQGSFRTVVETAGMMAAKRTWELVPHCHPLPLSHIAVTMSVDELQGQVLVEATVKTRATTGVEMEAMTAVSVAALTVYDMVKAVDPAAIIHSTKLVEKHGGRSGDLVLER